MIGELDGMIKIYVDPRINRMYLEVYAEIDGAPFVTKLLFDKECAESLSKYLIENIKNLREE